MGDVIGSGYLASAEANHLGAVSGPNVVYLRMIRTLSADAQKASMFVEMTPGQARLLITRLEKCVREALAYRD